ncbi:MAG: cadherin repeat domain-containing protein, partial [Thiohalomonadales bacterium]
MLTLIKLLCLSFMALFFSACSDNLSKLFDEENKKPVFNIPSEITVDENVSEVIFVDVYDPESSKPVEIKINGGEDEKLFEIIDSTLVFSKSYVPDYEEPKDKNGDNVYFVNISATDVSSVESALSVSVTIKNINDNVPKFSTAQALSIVENERIIGSIVATDADGGDLFYFMSGGVDVDHFQLKNNQLEFKNVPDFESPQNFNSNSPNIYSVEVTVEDEQKVHSVSRIFQVKVENLLPAMPIVSVLSSEKKLTFSWSPDDFNETGYYELHKFSSNNSRGTLITRSINSYQYIAEDEISVHLEDWDNLYYVLNACDSSQCVSTAPVFVKNKMLDAIGYLKASNSIQDKRFGNNVVLSADGNTFVVIAQSVVDFGAYQTYVYSRKSNAHPWVEIELNIARDLPGPLAISGDGSTIAIGDVSDSSAATGIDGDQVYDCVSVPKVNCGGGGAVFIFHIDNIEQKWKQQSYIKSKFQLGMVNFGSSLDLNKDGDILAIGNPWEFGGSVGINGNQRADCNTATNPVNCRTGSGAAYIVKRNSVTGKWKHSGYFKPDGIRAGTSNIRFGASVTLNDVGDIFVVSAVESAYVYRLNGNVWTQSHKIKSPGNVPDSIFALVSDLSGDGNTLALGYPYWGGIGIYQFSKNTGSWRLQHTAMPIDAINSTNYKDNYFGMNISLSNDGNKLAVGLFGNNNNTVGVGSYSSNDCVSQNSLNC